MGVIEVHLFVYLLYGYSTVLYSKLLYSSYVLI